MTIGIAISSFLARGTEKQALRLSNEFVNNGHKVVIFVIYKENHQHLLNDFKRLGVEIINLARFSKYKIFHFILFIRAIKQTNCNILLSRAKLTNKITGLAGWISSVPSVVVLSGAIFKKEVNNTLFRRLKVIYNLGLPSKIISVSKQGAENFIYRHPFLKNRVTYILNGIEKIHVDRDDVIPFKKEADFNFCYTGSLVVYRKGIDILIKVVKKLSQKYSSKEINLILIGSGAGENEIKKLTIDLGIADYIVFTGEQPNPFEIMIHCDAFVLPSRKEGLPNALLEAMGLGLPSIASDCITGPREIIDNNMDGILVPVEDIEALEGAMELILKNREFATQLGVNAKEKILNNFQLERMSNQYLQVFTEISEGKF